MGTRSVLVSVFRRAIKRRRGRGDGGRGGSKKKEGRGGKKRR